MPAPSQHNNSEAIAWCRGGDVSDVVHFTFQGKDVPKFFPTKVVAHEFEDVDVGNEAWPHACSIQFLSVDVGRVGGIVSVSVGIPLLVGIGPTHRQSAVKAEGLDAGDDGAISAPESATRQAF